MSEPNADYGHILHVIVDAPHVVDDYGNEVYEAEVSYRLDCLGVTDECRGLIECDCVHPEDDERFADGDDSEAFRTAMAEYEDRHPESGWEIDDHCWAQSALCDWDPDERWERGSHPVKVKADRSWGGPEDAALRLIPATTSNGSWDTHPARQRSEND